MPRIDFNIWADWQAVASSVLMSRAMWPLWLSFRSSVGPYATPTILAFLWCMHGFACTILFASLAYMVTAENWVMSDNAFMTVFTLWTVAGSTVMMIALKSTMIWLGEHRGAGGWWRTYVGCSVLWALAAIIF